MPGRRRTASASVNEPQPPVKSEKEEGEDEQNEDQDDAGMEDETDKKVMEAKQPKAKKEKILKKKKKDEEQDNADDEKDENKKMKAKPKSTPKSNKKSEADEDKPSAKKSRGKSKVEDPPTSDDDDDDEDDTAACCLCHAAVDYSDMEWFGQGEDIVANLPRRWQDPNNALIYCDGCDRMFHQKCHFVPLLVLPRGDWHCLICQFDKQQRETEANSKKRKKGKKSKASKNGKDDDDDNNIATTITTTNTSIIYPLLTKDNYTNVAMKLSQRLEQYKAELEFEFHSRSLKASSWKQELQVRFQRSVSQMVQSLQQAQTELETLTSSHRNRKYFIESTQHLLTTSSTHSHTTANGTSSSSSKRRIQQQLHQTVYQYAWRKFQLRQALMNLSKIIQDTDQTWQELQCYLQHQPPSLPPSPPAMESSSSEIQHVAITCFPFGQPLADSTITATTTTTSSSNSDDAKKGPPTPPSAAANRRYCRRRIVPRTREWKRHVPSMAEIEAAETANKDEEEDDDDQHQIPQEIQVADTQPSPKLSLSSSPAKKNGQNHPSPSAKGGKKESSTPPHETNADDDDDDDSGISLDDLQCCVCFKSEASDDNDLILCDGLGCCRAYHVHCLDPPPPAHVLEQADEDWFCPMCSTLAQTLLQVQSQYLQDEDWQLQRQSHHHQHPDKNDVEVASMKSWENAFQAFPEAPWQYETALLLKQGQQNEDTDRLLRQLLGLDQPDHEGSPGKGKLHSEELDDDDDDEEEDPNFEIKDKREQDTQIKDDDEGKDEDDDSIDSSEATLVDVSSVELEISEDELNALSGQEESGSDDDDDEEDADGEKEDDNDQEHGGNRRRSRRRLNGEANQKADSDAGKLNRDNIIWGKRRRKTVDYRRLNDAIFGDLDEEEVAKIDDAEEFVVASASRKTVSTNSGSSSSNSGESDDDDDNMQQSDGSDSGSEKGEEADNSDDSDDNSEIEQPPKRRRTSQTPRERPGRNETGGSKASKANAKTGKKVATRKPKNAAVIKKNDTVVAKSAKVALKSPSENSKGSNGYHAATPKTKARNSTASASTAHESKKKTSRRKA